MRLMNKITTLLLGLCMSNAIAMADNSGGSGAWLEMDPPRDTQPGMAWFYNTKTNSWNSPVNCLKTENLNPNLTMESLTSAPVETGIDWTQSTAEIHEKLGVSAYVDLAAASGNTELGFSLKVDYARDYHVTEGQQSIVAYYRNYDRAKRLDYVYGQNLRLTQNAETNARTNSDAFIQDCGNYIVVGIQEGYDYLALGRFQTRDIRQEETVSVDADLQVKTQQVNFSGGVDIDSLKEAHNTGASFHAEEYGKERSSAIQSPEELLNAYKALEGQNPQNILRKQVVKLFLAPVSSSVIQNYPGSGPLAITPREATLRSLSATLWELNAAIEVADKALIQENSRQQTEPGLYAFGTSPARRVTYGRSLQRKVARWKSIRNTLRAKAGRCLRDYDTSCDATAAKWDLTGGSSGYQLLKEFVWVPAKKSLNCDNTFLQPTVENVRLQHEAGGDRNIGAGPALIRARLSTYTRNNLQLWNRFVVRVQEYKKHPNGKHNTDFLFNTKFGADRSLKVADFEGTGCRFVDQTGVSPANNRGPKDPFARRGSRSLKGTVGSLKQVISHVPNSTRNYDKQRAHNRGVWRRKLRRVEAAYPRNSGRKNALKDMKCWVSDGYLSPDHPVCINVRTKKVLLKLQSADDQAADRLAKAPKRFVAGFAGSRGKTASKHSRIVRRFAKQKKGLKNLKRRVKRGIARRTTQRAKWSKKSRTSRPVKWGRSSRTSRTTRNLAKTFSCQRAVSKCKKKKSAQSMIECLKRVSRVAKKKKQRCGRAAIGKTCKAKCRKVKKSARNRCIIGCVRKQK